MNPRIIVLSFIFISIQCSNSLRINLSNDDKRHAIRAVSNSINQFSSEFYEALSNEVGDNFICSPLSAAMVLMMASYGARGKTADEMTAVLHFDNENIVQKNGINYLIDNFNAIKKSQVKLANKIFVTQGMAIKPEFRNVTESTFRSAAESLDFMKADAASQTINSWCEEQTNFRIKDVVQSGDLSADTALVLVNAVYFKGKWADKFVVNDTQPRTFNLDDERTKTVPMMHRLGNYRYGLLPDLNARFIEIPYESTDENDSLSMIIILPNEVTGLRNIEEGINKIKFERLLSGEQYEIDLFIPKFKIESKIDLKNSLNKLGMKKMFEDSANFTGIIDSPALKVSKIVQKAFIEVNEEGSEAAAATVFDLQNRLGFSENSLKRAHFHVDRPFVLQIVSEHTVIFSGHIKDIDIDNLNQPVKNN
ncbi:antichymotrypsin-2 [Microplitis demolitor]|uniref:antichymotrypsin-2 n=1 Tax=Microplitis demolitor TaxID=69319 RepID=UPI0004CD251E|nr:antichymotrypsin-2 [Microplitis demolitor]